MPIHHHGQVADSAPCRHGVGALLDEVRSVDADDVHPEQLVRVLVVEDLETQTMRVGEAMQGLKPWRCRRPRSPPKPSNSL